MRVAIYYSNNDLRIEERPVPKIGKDELLVKVAASGVCGTDVMEWYRINRVPLVLGHEIAGEIVEAGKGVTRYQKGQRIACSHHVPCGECHYCNLGHETVCDTLRTTSFDPGGFAEFVRLPAVNVKTGVYLLPEEVSYEEATFTEPLACVLRGQRIAGVRAGQTVLVIGSGISGLLHIQAAKLNGAAKIMATDIIDYRLDLAKKLGADFSVDARQYKPENLFKINDSRGADVVILCASAESAIEQALKSIARGGTILFFAAANQGVKIPVDINELFWRNEVTLISSYAATPQEHLRALSLIARRMIKVDEMITHRLALDEIQKGFKLVAEAKESMKVIIEPQR
ncbi:MAG: zinc-dependent dehydrogenase [Candidatus Omnitrophica bacterium]|nr:zinc-dependent dehydrogenase [Candidatus Omnitrophota bacterium]